MLAPAIFRKNNNIWDDWFDDFGREMDHMFMPAERALYGHHAAAVMKTDVQEKDNEYILDIDLPGFKKEEIQAELNDGYLTVSASKSLDKEKSDKKEGKVIRKERYAGTVSRSFYVGDVIKEEDIKAKYENGVLSLTIPKKEPTKEIPEKKLIAIEG